MNTDSIPEDYRIEDTDKTKLTNFEKVRAALGGDILLCPRHVFVVKYDIQLGDKATGLSIIEETVMNLSPEALDIYIAMIITELVIQNGG